MRALRLHAPAPVETRPLVLEDVPDPTPGPGQVLVKVSACGICRTDLHVVEGELPVAKPLVIPGHQVAGTVAAAGDGRRSAPRPARRDRVAPPDLRRLPLLHERPREPVRRPRVHGLDRRRRLRHVDPGRGGFRLRASRRILRRRRGAASLRGHHRLPRSPPDGPRGPPLRLPRGAARPLRLRRGRAHRDPDRARARRRRLRDDARPGAPPGPRRGARGRVGRRRARRPPVEARRRDHLRPRRRADSRRLSPRSTRAERSSSAEFT